MGVRGRGKGKNLCVKEKDKMKVSGKQADKRYRNLKKASWFGATTVPIDRPFKSAGHPFTHACLYAASEGQT